MYLVTNREVRGGKPGFDAFGEKPNPKGPHELRFAEVLKSESGYHINILDDTLSRVEKIALDLPVSKSAYRSKLVARNTFDKIRREKTNLLLFVHGFNNNVKAVVDRAFGLQQQFGVEVLAFSWPANGGGASGTLDYKSDKKDARASIGALDRVLDKMRQYLHVLRQEELERIRSEANDRYPKNAETRDEFLARAIQEDCPFRVTLMLHSMGNYLLKQLLKSTLYSADELLFDNVVMVAADTNNKDHREWIDRIEFRNRLYVTINENDSALRFSRIKGGSEQRARLGHFPYELYSRRAVYVDVTGASNVEDSHAYFEGDSLKNDNLKKFFIKALNGKVADDDLDYDASRNLHSVSP